MEPQEHTAGVYYDFASKIQFEFAGVKIDEIKKELQKEREKIKMIKFHKVITSPWA